MVTGADVGGSQQMAWPESIRAEVEWAIGGKHDRRDVLDAEDVPFESVDALNTCLAAMDIPAWILAGLSIVCGVACVASFSDRRHASASPDRLAREKLGDRALG
ncbi:hypothetical protein GCM10009532_03160 [Microbacterium aurantiacum]